jgi:hypothetical protein
VDGCLEGAQPFEALGKHAAPLRKNKELGVKTGLGKGARETHSQEWLCHKKLLEIEERIYARGWR